MTTDAARDADGTTAPHPGQELAPLTQIGRAHV